MLCTLCRCCLDFKGRWCPYIDCVLNSGNEVIGNRIRIILECKNMVYRKIQNLDVTIRYQDYS